MIKNGTFAYAPDIAVYVHTRKAGVIDLSKDIERFNMVRATNQASTFSCTFDNKWGRYDRVIGRMSRITVFLKRTNWLQTFSGYVSSAPYESITPGPAELTAYCTLVRLQHIYWDRFTPQAMELFPAMNKESQYQKDGGAAAATVRLLAMVGDWNPRYIHIQKIPKAFIRQAARLAKNSPDVDEDVVRTLMGLLDSEGYSAGKKGANKAAANLDASSGLTGNLGNTNKLDDNNNSDRLPSGQGSIRGEVTVNKTADSSIKNNQLGVSAVEGNWNVYSRVLAAVQRTKYTYVISSWKRNGSPTASRHNIGLGIDIGVGSSGRSDKEMRVLVNELKKENPNELFYKEILLSDGNSFVSPSLTAGHLDHIHVAWDSVPGAASVASGSGSGGSGGDTTDFNVFFNHPQFDPESLALTGERAFINDTPLFDSVAQMTQAGLRNFQSAPNGDFVAFFPDKFGIWKRSPVLKVRDIEIMNFNIQISDENLKTHVAVISDLFPPMQGLDADRVFTEGIVTVENDKVLKLMLGLDPRKEYKGYTGEWIMKKFGMRPQPIDIPEIRNHKWEFFYALHKFMEFWSMQFITQVDLTFMPELYPGMRIHLVDHDLAVYVDRVTHSGSRQDGFTTTLVISSPMKLKNGEWVLLPMERKPVEMKRDESDPESTGPRNQPSDPTAVPDIRWHNGGPLF